MKKTILFLLLCFLYKGVGVACPPEYPMDCEDGWCCEPKPICDDIGPEACKMVMCKGNENEGWCVNTSASSCEDRHCERGFWGRDGSGYITIDVTDKIIFKITVTNGEGWFCYNPESIVQDGMQYDIGQIDFYDMVIEWENFDGCGDIFEGVTATGTISGFPSTFDIWNSFRIYCGIWEYEDYFDIGPGTQPTPTTTTSSTTTSILPNTTTTTQLITTTTTQPTTTIASTSTTTILPTPDTFSISGHVRGDLVSDVFIILSGTASKTTATDVTEGYYEFSDLNSGNYTITPVMEGFIFQPSKYVIQNLTYDMQDKNFISSQIKPVSPCALELIYGEDSSKVQLLKFIRDNILSKTVEGREIIKLYYEWNPTIIEAIENDPETEEKIRELVDGIIEIN